MKTPPLLRRAKSGHAFFTPSKVFGNLGAYRIGECSDLDVSLHLDAEYLRLHDYTNQTPGQIQRWRDRSRHRHDLKSSLTAAFPQFIPFGKHGKPIARFDGTRLLQFVGMPLGRLINGLNGGVTAVFRKRQSLTQGALIACNAGSTNATLAIYPYLNSTQTQFDLGNVSQGGRQTISQNYSGNWHVETWQRTNGRFTTWRDGVLVAGDSTADSLAPAVTAVGTLYLGYDAATTPTQGFVGDLAELIIHREPIPWSQVPGLHQLMKEKWGLGGIPGKAVGLRGQIASWDAYDLERVDGASVTNWPANVGGSSYNFDTVAGTGPTLQIGDDGMPGVLFGGAGGLKTSASVDPFSSGNSQTLYAVIRPGAQTVTFAPILAHQVNTSARNFVWSIRNGTSPNNYWGMYNAQAGSVTSGASTASWDGGRMVMVLRRNGATISHMLDFNTYSAHAVTSTWTTYSDPLSLGVKDNVNDGMVGSLHELIICNTNHSDQEMTDYRRLLAKKWNCSAV